ncbi:MAG: IS66 family transposase [Desulfotomaculaceae bacterium]
MSETTAPTEDSPSLTDEDNAVPATGGNSSKSDASQHSKRKRGARPGHKGHGRKIPENLPVIRKVITVPEGDRFCPECGKECADVPFTENSTQIDVKIEIYRVEYVRKRVKRTCECTNAGNLFITAPLPPQVIPKCKFSHNLLSLLIVLKYLFAIPLQRMLTILGMQGAALSSGSITGVFKKLLPLLEPLYKSLVVESREDEQWNVDETGWMSFIRQADKKGFLTWMWVFASKKVVLYVQDPSRSSKVPLAHLGEKARGIVIADRFSAYGKLAKMAPGLVIAICWAHFRRDFINAGKSFEKLSPWALVWKKRIAEIYRLNHRRLDVVKDRQRFAEAQRELEIAIEKMKAAIAAELKESDLHWNQRRVLMSAQKHWAGLTVFVQHHEVPMDNNRAERALRRIALGRNNYYGTYAQWSGQFAAVCLSMLQTAVMHGLKPTAYLRYYLDACAKAGGVPEQLQHFHPWNIPEHVREEYGMQQKGGKL